MYIFKRISTSATFLLFVLGLQAQPGTLDSSFGVNGTVEFSNPGQDTWGFSVCIQPDGKILSFGQGDYSTGEVFVLRYLPNGDVDPSFGNNGVQAITIPGTRGTPFKVQLQPDGKILGGITAQTLDWTNSEIALFRLLPSGSPDPEFGVSGIVTQKIDNNPTYGGDFTLQTDGKILVFESYDKDKGSEVAATRLNSDGSVDASFATNGTFLWSYPSLRKRAAKIVSTDQGIYFSGSMFNNAGELNVIYLVKLQPDGSPDNTFGAGSIVTFTRSNSLITKALEVLSDGKILIAGDYGYSLDNTDFMLLRLNPDGSVDDNFGQNGVVRTQVAGDFNYVGAMLIQPDGKIILAGDTQYKCWCSAGGLARFGPDGQLDLSFGTGGKSVVYFNKEGGFDGAALQQDGKIVVCGYTSVDNGSTHDFTMNTCRLNNDLLVASPDLPGGGIDAQIAPNPAVQSNTNCHLILSAAAEVSVVLTNSTGSFIGRVFQHYLPAGAADIPVSLQNLPGGIYFLDIQIGQTHLVRKVAVQ